MSLVKCNHGLSSSEYCRLCKELSEKTLYGNLPGLEEEQRTERENTSSDTTPAKSKQPLQLKVSEDRKVDGSELQQREETVVQREKEAARREVDAHCRSAAA